MVYEATNTEALNKEIIKKECLTVFCKSSVKSFCEATFSRSGFHPRRAVFVLKQKLSNCAQKATGYLNGKWKRGDFFF